MIDYESDRRVGRFLLVFIILCTKVDYVFRSSGTEEGCLSPSDSLVAQS